MAPASSHPYTYLVPYPAAGALNQPSSEGSDVSPTSRVTSHGIYSVDTQSGANTLNSLGRQIYGSRQHGASRKRGACESFISGPTDEAGAPGFEAPPQLDNDEDDLNDTDDNTTQVRDVSWSLWLCHVAACACGHCPPDSKAGVRVQCGRLLQAPRLV